MRLLPKSSECLPATSSSKSSSTSTSPKIMDRNARPSQRSDRLIAVGQRVQDLGDGALRDIHLCVALTTCGSPARARRRRAWRRRAGPCLAPLASMAFCTRYPAAALCAVWSGASVSRCVVQRTVSDRCSPLRVRQGPVAPSGCGSARFRAAKPVLSKARAQSSAPAKHTGARASLNCAVVLQQAHLPVVGPNLAALDSSKRSSLAGEQHRQAATAARDALVLAASVAIGLSQHHCGRKVAKPRHHRQAATSRSCRSTSPAAAKWPGAAAAAEASPQQRN